MTINIEQAKQDFIEWAAINSPFTIDTDQGGQFTEQSTQMMFEVWLAASRQYSQNNEQPTLRDKFAMSVLNGCLAADPKGSFGLKDFASLSYEMADIMLKEREK